MTKRICRITQVSNTMVITKNFIKTMENPVAQVDNCISTEVETRVISNRKFLRTVIHAVEYCGRQGIVLRGHRDDGDIFNCNFNQGNFKELLLLMAESDTNLENYLKTCSRNALYISKTTQNDLLQCIKSYMESVIINEVKKQTEGPYYGVSGDEVTDSSNWEQLGIVLQYVKDFTPVERLF